VSLIVILSLYLFKIGHKIVKRIVLITVKFLFKFLKFLFSLFFINLNPFLIIFFCKFVEVLLNSTLQLLHQIWMSLF